LRLDGVRHSRNVTDNGDDELVARAKTGDLDAFSALVARHQPLALRIAYTLVGDEAPDVVQDAMVKAYRNLDRFRAGGPFRAWLLRIVTNESSNRRRSAGRRAQLALRVRAEISSGDTTLSPEEVAVAHERREVLAAAVARLPDMDRRVIALRWFAELSEAEMAIALDCAPGTVKSRLARAMDRLRHELGEAGRD
jgi:RNA polymerase sigma factor (sigma-70 family)